MRAGFVICELCGAEVPRLKSVAIDATILSVCEGCSRFGEAVAAPTLRPGHMPPVIAQRLEARQRRMTPKDVYTEGGELELADDFPARIRSARESRGWKQADLAAKINERASVIAKLESGTISPGDDLVRKLERQLGIKLKERVQPVAVKKGAAGGGVTLGDLVKMDDDG
ncbi:MAG TPA: multiprotein bridging factor aMBF1 [Thermoplasmata archaeon]|nr:multiprotein bridging factor aMBF1 [Thermoplasmata archaeon]